MTGSFKYRPDIDGLRAVAVLAVVFYHAHVPWFGGGYIGVDVFFVISGFLITSILLPDIRARRLRLVLFYERRIRRIFPALFAVIGACFLAAWWLFMPDQLESLGRSAIYGALFVSNIFFRQQESDYFAHGLDLSPLLHTWSLAVEEQFYIVYPVSLYLAFRFFKRRAPLALTFVLVASFGVAAWAVGTHPQGAFYRSSLRGWELLTGSLLALDVIPELTRRWHRELAATSGLALICWSIVTYSDATPFPGIAALAPCLGAFLVIVSGHGGRSSIGLMLGLRPFVFVGIISYSLYLWHWPIFVFCRQIYATLSPLITTGAIGASFLIAALSWRYIEQPFRRPGAISRGPVFALATCSLAAAVSFGGVVVGGGGIPSRLPPDTVQILNARMDADPRLVECGRPKLADISAGRLCHIGHAGASAPRFVLWGDSHAGALTPGVEAAADRYGLNGVLAEKLTCPPLIGVSLGSSGEAGLCKSFNDLILRYIRNSPSVHTVILMARWAIYAEGTDPGRDRHIVTRISDDRSTSTGVADRHHVFATSLAKTVRAIEQSGKHVVVVGPVPEMKRWVAEWLAVERLTGHNHAIAPTRLEFLARQRFVFDSISRLKDQPALTVIYPDSVLCPPPRCKISDGVHPYYPDDNHLSIHGSLAISSLFDSVMEAIASASDGSS